MMLNDKMEYKMQFHDTKRDKKVSLIFKLEASWMQEEALLAVRSTCPSDVLNSPHRFSRSNASLEI